MQRVRPSWPGVLLLYNIIRFEQGKNMHAGPTNFQNPSLSSLRTSRGSKARGRAATPSQRFPPRRAAARLFLDGPGEKPPRKASFSTTIVARAYENTSENFTDYGNSTTQYPSSLHIFSLAAAESVETREVRRPAEEPSVSSRLEGCGTGQGERPAGHEAARL